MGSSGNAMASLTDVFLTDHSEKLEKTDDRSIDIKKALVKINNKDVIYMTGMECNFCLHTVKTLAKILTSRYHL